MLPVARRLRHSDDFSLAMRGGVRAGSRRLVVHWTMTGAAHPTRVGFVVSKAVGNAVIRHRTQRRLRHLIGQRLTQLPGNGGLLVVRALPVAAQTATADLGRDIDRGLRKVLESAVGSGSGSASAKVTQAGRDVRRG